MFRPTKNLKTAEFVSLLAMMISILALSIDAVLPAFDLIARDFKLANPNDAQLVLSAMFLGFAVGQLAVGPLSDCYGRKPVIYIGYVIFIVGCLVSLMAEDYNLHLSGRVLQGLGAAAPRIVGVALVRDGYEGREMARIMSIVMAIFILVPVVAPGVGQAVMLFADWRMIYVLFLAMALIAFIWFAVRQPETLTKPARHKFSVLGILTSIREAVGYRVLTGYTIALGIIFGAFLGYLNSAQAVFRTTFGAGDLFAVYFGFAALSIGAASVVNSALVVRLGMRYLTWRALVGITLLACVMAIGAIVYAGPIPLWLFMVWLLASFFCIGILFGNFYSMAMEPVGHMAGVGAAVVGSVSTFISLPLGWAIGVQFDGSIIPLTSGFAVSGILTLAVMWWTELGQGST